MSQEIPLYQVDAFATSVFSGNPAAVCPLETWLPDDLMQSIAMENNLAETAYFVGAEGDYELRWFTPEAEMDLCGHATLASAYVISTYLDPGREAMRFDSRSGPLAVTRSGDLYTLDFPITPMAARPASDAVTEALGQAPKELWEGMDIMAVLENEAQIQALDPDSQKVAALNTRGLVVTAPGDEVDFVSRFFAPCYGVLEDPVTGSTHTALTPYWAEKLGKTRMVARQLSQRGGELTVELAGTRVMIGGGAVPYLVGTIRV